MLSSFVHLTVSPALMLTGFGWNAVSVKIDEPGTIETPIRVPVELTVVPVIFKYFMLIVVELSFAGCPSVCIDDNPKRENTSTKIAPDRYIKSEFLVYIAIIIYGQFVNILLVIN